MADDPTHAPSTTCPLTLTPNSNNRRTTDMVLFHNLQPVPLCTTLPKPPPGTVLALICLLTRPAMLRLLSLTAAHMPNNLCRVLAWLALR